MPGIALEEAGKKKNGNKYKGKTRCFKCGDTLHFVVNCPKKDLKCHEWRDTRHLVMNCKNKKNKQKHSVPREEEKSLVAFLNMPRAVKRILRYLKGTIDLELIYGKTDEDIVGYCDAGWAGDMDERKSTTGYVFTYRGGLITWSTKRQQGVALSSTEAEFMEITAAAQEAIWLKQIMMEISPKPFKSVKIFNDNKGVLELAKSNSFSPRSEHIDIKHKFIHEKVNKGEILLVYQQTNEMPADIMTQVCPNNKITGHRT